MSLSDSSYIALRNLSLDGQGKAGDGVKAEATAVSVHHILIDGLSLRNFNQDLQVTGINTKQSTTTSISTTRRGPRWRVR